MRTETVKKTIDGDCYECYTMAPRQALRLSLKLGRIVTPAGAPFADPGATASESFLLAATTFFDRMTEPMLDELLDIVGDHVWLKGSKLAPIAEAHFKGRLLVYVQVVAFFLEANFKDFLGAIQDASGLAASPREG